MALDPARHGIMVLCATSASESCLRRTYVGSWLSRFFQRSVCSLPAETCVVTPLEIDNEQHRAALTPPQQAKSASRPRPNCPPPSPSLEAAELLARPTAVPSCLNEARSCSTRRTRRWTSSRKCVPLLGHAMLASSPTEVVQRNEGYGEQAYWYASLDGDLVQQLN